MIQPPRVLSSFGVAFLGMVLQHRSGSHFLNSLAVPASFLSLFLDVLVHPFFLRTDSTQMAFSRHFRHLLFQLA
jgi:hypothetical protein